MRYDMTNFSICAAHAAQFCSMVYSAFQEYGFVFLRLLAKKIRTILVRLWGQLVLVIN